MWFDKAPVLDLCSSVIIANKEVTYKSLHNGKCPIQNSFY